MRVQPPNKRLAVSLLAAAMECAFCRSWHSRLESFTNSVRSGGVGSVCVAMVVPLGPRAPWPGRAPSVIHRIGGATEGSKRARGRRQSCSIDRGTPLVLPSGCRPATKESTARHCRNGSSATGVRPDSPCAAIVQAATGDWHGGHSVIPLSDIASRLLGISTGYVERAHYENYEIVIGRCMAQASAKR
jgi:hypothetical protein